MLTGRPPFRGENAMEVMIAHARDPVTPPSQLRPDIPADLERVVLRCLAKNPDDRYPDTPSLAEDLDALRRRRQLVATPRRPLVARPPRCQTPTRHRSPARDRESLAERNVEPHRAGIRRSARQVKPSLEPTCVPRDSQANDEHDAMKPTSDQPIRDRRAGPG